MRTKRKLEIILNGLIAYLVLTLILYGLQSLTNLPIYTLLINYEFIPYVNINSFFAISLNLLMSVILAFFFYKHIIKRAWRWQDILFHLTFGIMFVGFVTYPLTYFSKVTPPLFHIFSFVFWIVSFMIYGLSMSLGFIYLLNKNKRQKNPPLSTDKDKKVVSFNRKP